MRPPAYHLAMPARYGSGVVLPRRTVGVIIAIVSLNSRF